MDENINKHLHDILDAINEIESFFGDKPKYFNEFCNDLCLRRAVERDIEIIGEAMNRILKENRNIAIEQDSEREQEHSHYQFPKDSGCKELYHTWL